MIKLNRNKYLAMILLVLVFLVGIYTVCSCASPATFKFKLTNPNAPGAMPTFVADVFADQVKELSNGRIIITNYHNGVLANEKEGIELVNQSQLDFAMCSAMALGSYVPEFSIFDAAYLFNNVEEQTKYVDSEEGQKLLNRLGEKTNMKIVFSGSYGIRHLTCSKEVHKPEDLKGLKIRSMDYKSAIENVASLGANPIPVAFTDLYMALQQGIVDGQENPLPTILASKFYEVQDYLILTGHVTCYQGIVMNKDKFNSLPEDLQQVILEAAKRTRELNYKELQVKESLWLKELEDKGMKVIIPDVELFCKHAQQYLPTKMGNVWGQGLYEKICGIQ